MGWAVGYDHDWQRDIGYGVPAVCDHPGCNEKINRGLAHVCGQEPFGGNKGCGLYFCSKHLVFGKGTLLCDRCTHGRKFYKAKPDVMDWIKHKLRDQSWKPWRDQNQKQVTELKRLLAGMK